jgi:LacI family transcriptional regulator
MSVHKIKVITQREIAQRLGISEATVCRILNNRTCHQDETRVRVLALAAQLGYRHLRPTVHRKVQMKRRSSMLVGVLIETGNDHTEGISRVAMRILRGMSSAARMENLSLHLEYFSPEEITHVHMQEHYPPVMRDGLLTGLLLMGHFSPEAITQFSRQTPCVRLITRDAQVAVDCVGQNDMDAADKLVGHLYELGHRKIGFLSETTELWPVQNRLAGYMAAMIRRDMEFHPDYIVRNPSRSISANWETSYPSVLQLIRKGVCAWIGNHDDVGYGLISFLRKQGLHVPQDVSICGFDDLESYDSSLPKVTTIRWPFDEIGAAGVRRLIHRMQNLSAPASYTMLQGTLLPSLSTAALPLPAFSIRAHS